MRLLKTSWALFPCVPILAAWLMAGCATTGIPKKIRAQADRNITLAQVRANPEAFQNKIVLWGGEVLDLKNAKDGTTMEVLQTPLDGDDRPESRERSEGRFLVFSDQYLDRMVYTQRRRVSIVGQVQGAETHPLGDGEMEYVYPRIRAQSIYLWPLPDREPRRPPFSVGLGFGYFHGLSPYWHSHWGLGWGPTGHDPWW